ncbi:hypothetical protein [Leptospira levettii]|uniref:Uncharacterized protein n=1 Tax=Leptospira levettii TaxID=2023178 RepID=A0AAW5V9B1_9LEPT|nr:hypothetical protein [Leptospira levettii]MCW7467662.1 hypothetical protein [Leptospira levettii]MCW7513342.1 hypothetical protein [Leptospira levettii]MCW7517065.1 hypothetical protein [Leptospira levettii]
MKSDQNITLNKWIEKNYKSLNRELKYPLVPNAQKNKKVFYQFISINENLYLEIFQDSAKIQYQLKENKYETLVDLDISPSIDKNGMHFCSGCKKRKKFKNRSEFIKHHFIDTLKAFQNKSLKKNHYVSIVEIQTLDLFLPLILNKSEMLSLLVSGKLPKKNKSKDNREQRPNQFSKMKFQLLRAERVVI